MTRDDRQEPKPPFSLAENGGSRFANRKRTNIVIIARRFPRSGMPTGLASCAKNRSGKAACTRR
ncbi:MAG: hypothetical protein A9Z00_06495 [Thermobacillus sp. ZCTH02-B1]|nr:MAG: hypothetical protein A9Z00_06495 [Thermobacillus sp. ZCTH02-B1]